MNSIFERLKTKPRPVAQTHPAQKPSRPTPGRRYDDVLAEILAEVATEKISR